MASRKPDSSDIKVSGYITLLNKNLVSGNPNKAVPFSIQWNPSNPDTSGPKSTVLIIEVSSLQGLEMYYGLL